MGRAYVDGNVRMHGIAVRNVPRVLTYIQMTKLFTSATLSSAMTTMTAGGCVTTCLTSWTVVRGISTVIHHRDFLPGSILEETIRESIDRSRFTVLVLSPDFLASNWCLLEKQVARNRIISEGRDVIVPL